MDRITICQTSSIDGNYIKIQILPPLENGNKPIYEGIMTFEEFGKCIGGIAYRNIKCNT